MPSGARPARLIAVMVRVISSRSSDSSSASVCFASVCCTELYVMVSILRRAPSSVRIRLK